MRYTILKPAAPVDPRDLSFASLELLRAEFPSIADCDLESQAMEYVRSLYPNAIVMPIPLELGSGRAQILGVLESIGSPKDPNGTIPFVLFVQAHAQSGAETALIKKNGQFSRHVWKIPVLAPPSANHQTRLVEVRGSDLEQPTRTLAKVFRRGDQLVPNQVIYLEIGGIELSVELLEDFGEV